MRKSSRIWEVVMLLKRTHSLEAGSDVGVGRLRNRVGSDSFPVASLDIDGGPVVITILFCGGPLVTVH